MNRVAIHLSGTAPINRNAMCAAFREIQHSGGRVVVLAHDAGSSDEKLRQLIHQLGSDFDQLFTLAGDECCEWVMRVEDRLQAPSETVH